ncbi:hypothetical protein VTN77DRAFT_2518 [Rasamsonia byssochlamydoides]|uniref:uncharacterized protein n=1 Tax=Rasamsonia byssochlamydoides TaxID=89139 RepID=UPI0037425868
MCGYYCDQRGADSSLKQDYRSAFDYGVLGVACCEDSWPGLELGLQHRRSHFMDLVISISGVRIRSTS